MNAPEQGINPVLTSLKAAVAANPDDRALRLHLVEMLLDHGRLDDAIALTAEALQRDPTDPQAQTLMRRAMTVPSPPAASPPQADTPQAGPAQADSAARFDWPKAEDELVENAGTPRFVETPLATVDSPAPQPLGELEGPSGLRLDDVGGMNAVKKRLQAAFLAPMRNPELRALYSKSLRGGLLLYGPPGCGKTFIARALAGELGARFLTIGLHDVLDMYLGQSEQNLHETFQAARRNAPCLIFLDEIDALGIKRSYVRHAGIRQVVNQLLTELDGAVASNDGLFVLGATNTPWDVDPALRRPGRFDRTLLVLPPDAPAREQILRYHLRDRPVAAVDLDQIVARTDGYSGADLEHLCETAAQTALLDSIETGTARRIGTPDLLDALDQHKPSTGEWFESARNVVTFSNQTGAYDELVAYFKRRR